MVEKYTGFKNMDCLYLLKNTPEVNLMQNHNGIKSQCIRVHGHKCLTCQAMPLVDSKEAVGSDSDYGS